MPHSSLGTLLLKNRNDLHIQCKGWSRSILEGDRFTSEHTLGLGRNRLEVSVGNLIIDFS